MKKAFRSVQVEVKAAEEGLVRAVFATMNVVDKDGDVTIPGAFGQQQVKLAAWGHNWGELPVGRGSISEQGESAIFDGQFFLDTTAGREHFYTIKNLGDLQEWSYGFDVKDSSEGEFDGQQVRFLKGLQVYEVSPVMLGAGVNTHTVAMKDGDADPPSLVEQADKIITEARAFIERVQSVTGDFAKDGRLLSGAKRERLVSIADLTRSIGDEVAELLKYAEQPAPEKLLALISEAQKLDARINRLAK